LACQLPEFSPQAVLLDTQLLDLAEEIVYGFGQRSDGLAGV
jgi:hypothetical protein